LSMRATHVAFLDAMRDRLKEFCTVAPPETDPLEIELRAASAANDRKALRGLGKPETFTFLGLHPSSSAVDLAAATLLQPSKEDPA